MKTKILVLSNTPWSEFNSFGNSYSNIFEGIEEFEFANIYCRYGFPHNNIVKKHFQITEKSLLKNLLDKKYPSGIEVINEAKHIDLTNNQKKIFDFTRKKRWNFFYLIRNCIWKIGNWKSDELKQFIDNFNPDILFFPIYNSVYINEIALFIKDYTNIPLIGYISDDNYSLKQISFSLFFWINKFNVRKKIKKIISQTSLLYVISEKQKKEYEKKFTTECKILTKGYDFKNTPIPQEQLNNKNGIELLYTGNIGDGRWNSLSILSDVITKINQNSNFFSLTICTMTPISKKMKQKLEKNPTTKLIGGLPLEEVKELQKKAHILLHVESFKAKFYLKYRLSFSTKIVDYFYQKKCILAFGTKGVSTLDYLAENDAAIVATSKKELSHKLDYIKNNPIIINEYSNRSWEMGKKNHQITNIQKMLKSDINQIISKESNENITN